MWIIRFLRTVSLYALVMTSLTLFALSYLNPKLFDKVRLFLLDNSGAVLVVFDRLASYAYSVQDKAVDIVNVYTINQQLRRQQRDYNQKSVQLALLTQEVKSLHGVLQYNSQFGVPDGFLAKVVGYSGGAYAPSFILDKGAIDGVRVGQVIVFNGYMAGYMIDVSRTISRAIPITNINASVPVMNGRGDKQGLILGDGARLPKFIYADTVADFRQDDILYTSGDGGVFPAGLPVGVIAAIHTPNNIRVSPYVRAKDMTFVYVLRHKPEMILQVE